MRYLVSLRRKGDIKLDASAIQQLLAIVNDKGYLKHMSPEDCLLKVLILPYWCHRDSIYGPDQNMIVCNVAEGSDERYVFLHEVGHSLHRNMVQKRLMHGILVPVESFIPIYDMTAKDTNRLASVDDLGLFGDMFAECFSFIVSMGHKELEKVHPARVFSDLTRKLLTYYFAEVKTYQNIAQASSMAFWTDKRKRELQEIIDSGRITASAEVERRIRQAKAASAGRPFLIAQQGWPNRRQVGTRIPK